MTATQELFEHLRDARPATPRHSKPVEQKPVPQVVRAVRFTVELPELGGAVSLSPWVGFEPVLCRVCEAPRPTEKHGPRTVAVLPCNCRGMR